MDEYERLRCPEAEIPSPAGDGVVLRRREMKYYTRRHCASTAMTQNRFGQRVLRSERIASERAHMRRPAMEWGFPELQVWIEETLLVHDMQQAFEEIVQELAAAADREGHPSEFDRESAASLVRERFDEDVTAPGCGSGSFIGGGVRPRRTQRSTATSWSVLPIMQERNITGAVLATTTSAKAAKAAHQEVDEAMQYLWGLCGLCATDRRVIVPAWLKRCHGTMH